MFRLSNALKPAPLINEMQDSKVQNSGAAENQVTNWSVQQKRNNYLKALSFFNDFFTEQEEQEIFDS